MGLVNLSACLRSVGAVGKILALFGCLGLAQRAAAGELAPRCIADLQIETASVLDVSGAGSRRYSVDRSRFKLDALAIEEDGVDLFVRALDANGRQLAIFDNPVARNGVQLVPAVIDGEPVAAIVLEGKEHGELRGRASVSALVFDKAAAHPRCVALVRNLGRADRDFGAVQAFKMRRLASLPEDSNAVLRRIQDRYRAARRDVAGLRVQDTAAAEAMLAALSYFSLDAWSEAADWATAASLNFARVTSVYAVARAKSLLASAWLEMSTASTSTSNNVVGRNPSKDLMQDTRAMLVELERFFASRRDPYFATLQTNNLGLSYFYQAEFELAKGYFARAEKSFRELAETQRAGLAIQNVALCDWGLGFLSAAIAGLNKAVALISPSSEPQLYAIAVNNLGLANYAAGHYDDAQRELSRAYQAAESSQVETFRARALFGLAVTQYALGDRSSVEQLLRNVLTIWTPQLDARGRVATLRALANVLRDQGRLAEAMQMRLEALSLSTMPSARGRILLDIAEGHLLAKDTESALKLLNPIAKTDNRSDRLLTALARLTRAVAFGRQQKFDAALADLQQALPVFRELQDVNAEFRCLLEIARVHDQSGDRRAAVAAIDQALELNDEIRNQTTNPEYRASLASSLREAQELRLSQYWRDYQKTSNQSNATASREVALKSLALVDSFRASVLDELRRGNRRVARSNPTGARQGAPDTLRQLAELRYQLTVRYERAGSNDKAAVQLRAKIAALRARLASESTGLSAGRASIQRRMAVTERRLDALGRTFPSRGFIEYWLGGKYAFVWVLRDNQVQWLSLDSPSSINRLAGRYSEIMPNGQNVQGLPKQKLLEDLHRMLLGKAASTLRDAKDWTIVADGSLSLVSFSTLRDRDRSTNPFVVQRAVVTMVPALGLVALDEQPRTRKRFSQDLLLVADPVYQANDPRFRTTASASDRRQGNRAPFLMPGQRTFRRLVWSGEEAKSIASLLPAERVDSLIGFAADRQALLSRDFRRYRFLHFAVHATTDHEVPQLSAVVLSQLDRTGRALDSEFRSNDFAALGIEAEAVVLSACSSAAGRLIEGEGVLGLQYAALAGGARSVIATYWEVQDEISAQLMTETYRRMLSANDSPSSAVGNAIRQVLQDQPNLDPSLWGAFAAYTILPRE